MQKRSRISRVLVVIKHQKTSQLSAHNGWVGSWLCSGEGLVIIGLLCRNRSGVHTKRRNGTGSQDTIHSSNTRFKLTLIPWPCCVSSSRTIKLRRSSYACFRLLFCTTTSKLPASVPKNQRPNQQLNILLSGMLLCGDATVQTYHTQFLYARYWAASAGFPPFPSGGRAIGAPAPRSRADSQTPAAGLTGPSCGSVSRPRSQCPARTPCPGAVRSLPPFCCAIADDVEVKPTCLGCNKTRILLT